MNPALDDDLVQRIDDLGAREWSGTVYRHTAQRRDPLSGAGARLFGGRWNPPQSFNAIYLATPLATCAGELRRAADSQGVSVPEFLTAGRILHHLTATHLTVLDLHTPEARKQVGLDLDDIEDDDRTACQAVGLAASFLGFAGVLAPSAAGTGLVLTAFEARIGPGQLRVDHSEPLTEAVFARMSD